MPWSYFEQRTVRHISIMLILCKQMNINIIITENISTRNDFKLNSKYQMHTWALALEIRQL